MLQHQGGRPNHRRCKAGAKAIFVLKRCVCVDHMKRCKTSIICGGPLRVWGVGGQRRHPPGPVKTYPRSGPGRPGVLSGEPQVDTAVAVPERCARSRDATERITDSPWAVTPSVGTAAGMSITSFSSFLFLSSSCSLIFKLLFTLCVQSENSISSCQCVHSSRGPTWWYEAIEGNTLPGCNDDSI